MTAIFDALSLLASVAPRVSVASLAITAAALLSICAWLDHAGAQS